MALWSGHRKCESHFCCRPPVWDQSHTGVWDHQQEPGQSRRRDTGVASIKEAIKIDGECPFQYGNASMPPLAKSHLKWARTSAFVFTVKADTGGDMHIWEGSTFQSGALCNTNNTRPSWEHCFLVKTYCILKGGDCLGRWQEKVY